MSNVDFTSKTATTVEMDIYSRFKDILNTINEQEYRGLDYLIDNYMKDETQIFVIGKDNFQRTSLDLNKSKWFNLFQGMDLNIFQGMDCIYYHADIISESNYAALFNKLNPNNDNKQRTSTLEYIKYPDPEDITP